MSPDPDTSDCNCVNILVVDDEPINIFALEMLLKRLGLKCESATNGSDCVKRLKSRVSIFNFHLR